MHRIREVINVLSDFKNKREPNRSVETKRKSSIENFSFFRSRKEYLDLLKDDLCNYYSYNDFLMSKLLDLFPLDEVKKILFRFSFPSDVF